MLQAGQVKEKLKLDRSTINSFILMIIKLMKIVRLEKTELKIVNLFNTYPIKYGKTKCKPEDNFYFS